MEKETKKDQGSEINAQNKPWVEAHNFYFFAKGRPANAIIALLGWTNKSQNGTDFRKVSNPQPHLKF